MDFKILFAFGQLIRLPNLLIVLGTLILIHCKTNGIESGIHNFELLLIGTTLIAAAGNIINDIFDVEMDRINKPTKVIVGRLIAIQNARRLYFLLNGIALGGVLYWGTIELVAFFLLAIALLYFYSYQWKRMPLIGNVVVAFLCALVVVEYWWIARTGLTNYWSNILLSYAVFAFLATLARELVKDIEDMEGDLMAGCRTLAIWLGEPITKQIVLGIFSGLLIVLSCEASFFYTNGQQLPCIYTIVILISAQCILGYQLLQARAKTDYSKLSKVLKGYMLLGVFLLFLA